MDKTFIQHLEELEKQFNIDYNIVDAKIDALNETYHLKISPKEIEHRETVDRANAAHHKLIADLKAEFKKSIKVDIEEFEIRSNALYKEREQLKITLADAKQELFNRKIKGN